MKASEFFKRSPLYDSVEIVRVELPKCWICGMVEVKGECPHCGPVSSMGPSEEEERETWRRR